MFYGFMFAEFFGIFFAYIFSRVARLNHGIKLLEAIFIGMGGGLIGASVGAVVALPDFRGIAAAAAGSVAVVIALTTMWASTNRFGYEKKHRPRSFPKKASV